MEKIVDLHCHPSLKPFGRAYPLNKNNKDASRKDSIWHNDFPTRLDKLLNPLLTVTKFSQANFSALYKGNVRVVVAALNPPEKGFFESSLGTGLLGDAVSNFVTEFGNKMIDFIQENNNYFRELNLEYKFYRQLNNKKVSIEGKALKYKLTHNFDDILRNLDNPEVISVIFSIEGGHAFNKHFNRQAVSSEILDNIKKVKRWPHLPFFVTIAHHFDNGLGGHAMSLSDKISKYINQKKGLDGDITPLGKKVIKSLLSSRNGKRIYIDLKHASRKVRMFYYSLLDSDYKNQDLPIIVSHGAVNGYPLVDHDYANDDENGPFWGRDINFYDDEIIKIAMSHGIFGLQLDERLIANDIEHDKIKKSNYDKSKKLSLRAKLVWNHIQHIAEILDRENLYAWDITAIGSDNDGIVDPLDGFWTSMELPLLYTNLLECARVYINSSGNTLHPMNKNITPEMIMDKIFSGNAMEFLRKYYV